MKLGMFDKANYQPEKVLRGVAATSLKQAGFLCGLGALAGGPIFAVSLLLFLREMDVVDTTSLCIAGMFVGMFLFLLGMSLPYIVYISKELILIKDSLCDECKKNLEQIKRI
jgi:hypothetical protein